MAYSTAYSEPELAAYLSTVVGSISDVLGWDSGDWHYLEAINEALAAYGTDDIASITGTANVRKLRALARRELWRSVVAGLASFIDFNAPDGQALKESQYQAQATATLQQTEADCQALGIASDGLTVGTTRVCYAHERRWSADEFGAGR